MTSRRRSSRLFPAYCVALALMLLRLPLAAERVVAVGDVHGDLDAFTAVLRQTGLIDAQNRWTGGSATLVQTGDLLDRGAKSRAVMDLLMQLEKQAPKSGGRVVVLLGNHEVMNMIGDLRYTSTEEFASYADADSSRRRQQALRSYLAWSKRHGTAETTAEMQAGWLEKHPLGYVEQRAAMAPAGRYGKWLRRHAAVFEAADTVFVHGGISPKLASLSPSEINGRVAGELNTFDEVRALLLDQERILPFFNLEETLAAAKAVFAEASAPQVGMAPEEQDARLERARLVKPLLKPEELLTVGRDGPLWFRGFADWSDTEGAAQVDELLQAYHAAHFVVGHSTQKGRILARWGNKVFLIDTGINTAYAPGGRWSALELNDGQATAIYSDGRVVLAPKSALADGEPLLRHGGGQVLPTAAASAGSHVWLDVEGKPLPFQSDAETLEFLRSAKVVEDKGIPQGITGPRKLLLEKDGVRAHAVWRRVDEEKRIAEMAMGMQLFFRDSYIFEPAAYELSEMLGMHVVPPAVLRKYNGESGSVQIWVEKAMTETDRSGKKIAIPDVGRWNRQMNRMNVFDQLIYNTDRNRGNIIITGDWQVWLIDHTRAFRRIDKLLDPKVVKQCERTMFEKMKALDEPTLQQRLGPYLRRPEIKTLLKRRDIIVKVLTQLAAEKGENQVFYDMEPPAPEPRQ